MCAQCHAYAKFEHRLSTGAARRRPERRTPALRVKSGNADTAGRCPDRQPPRGVAGPPGVRGRVRARPAVPDVGRIAAGFRVWVFVLIVLERALGTAARNALGRAPPGPARAVLLAPMGGLHLPPRQHPALRAAGPRPRLPDRCAPPGLSLRRRRGPADRGVYASSTAGAAWFLGDKISVFLFAVYLLVYRLKPRPAHAARHDVPGDAHARADRRRLGAPGAGRRAHRRSGSRHADAPVAASTACWIRSCSSRSRWSPSLIHSLTGARASWSSWQADIDQRDKRVAELAEGSPRASSSPRTPTLPAAWSVAPKSTEK